MGGDATHADAVQQMILVTLAGTKYQGWRAHNTAVGGSAAAGFHG